MKTFKKDTSLHLNLNISHLPLSKEQHACFFKQKILKARLDVYIYINYPVF